MENTALFKYLCYLGALVSVSSHTSTFEYGEFRLQMSEFLLGVFY